MSCSACKARLRLEVLDLGIAPITNNLLSKPKKKFKQIYPLRVYVCNKCWLVQNKEKIDPKKIFTNDYPYFSSFSSSWLKHAEKFVNKIIKKFKLSGNSIVAEVASNDGYLLQFLKKRNIPCFGIEPTNSTALVAIKKKIKVFQVFFNTKTSKAIAKKKKVDIIIANNVLAHVPDLKDFIKSFKILLKKNGVAIFEFHYLVNLIQKCQFDTIYHEHYFYHSLYALDKVFKLFNLKVFDVEKIKSHGGSLRIYVANKESLFFSKTKRYKKLLNYEKKIGINLIRNKFKFFLEDCKKKNKKVVGYGAAAKGVTLINFANINNSLLKFIVDKNYVKQNKFLPKSNIKIVAEKELIKFKPDYVIIFPWNLKDEIKKELNYIRKWGGKFVIFIPSFQIIR